MKLKQVRESKGIKQIDLAEAIGVDEPMVSKFECYKCLPTPHMMLMLLKELECDINEIYEPKEITFKSCEKAKEESEIYNLSVRLPKGAKEFLNTALKKCGYKDKTYWVYRCFERLQKQYDYIVKAEKEKASPSWRANGKAEILCTHSIPHKN